MQYLPAPSVAQAHSVVQAALFVSVCVALVAFVPEKCGAMVASEGPAQPPPLAYKPLLQMACRKPKLPGSQPLRQDSKPVTQAVAVLPTLTEFGPGQRTSVWKLPAESLTSACVSLAL